MRFDEFRAAIEGELRRSQKGLPWSELKNRLRLPYEQPCPAWISRLEKEINLCRVKGSGRGFLWRIKRGDSA